LLTLPRIAPAKQALELEKKVFHISANDTNAFNGPPSTELDDAWHVLLKSTSVFTELSGFGLTHAA
jgi:hypothetical protein